MKREVAAAVIAALLATPVLAGEVAIPAGVFVNAQTADQYLAKDNLIGAKVHGPDGKIMGDIEDLILNDYNQVIGVVVGTGGFLGFAEKKIGVNMSALKFEDKDGKTEISLEAATADILGAVEPYKRTQPAKSLMERAKEKANELADKATAQSERAMEQAKPSLENTATQAQDVYERAKAAAQPALDKARAAIDTAVEGAKDAASSIEKKAEEAARALEENAGQPAPSAEPAPEAAPETAPEQ